MHFRFVGFVGRVVVTAVLIAAGAWAQAVQYKVIPITSPYDPPGSVQGSDINNHRVIPLTDYQTGQRQAFVWSGLKGFPLTLLGGPCGYAVGINDAGHIVGGACPPGSTLPHAYLYRNQNTEDLGTFGGMAAMAIRINKLNQIAGDYELANGTWRAFIWQRKHWTDIGSLAGSFTYAVGLNAFGVVTGQSDISNDPDPVFGIPAFHGFVWSAGSLTDLGSIFGSNFNYGNAINDAGVVTGSADLPGDTGAHAFLWNEGAVQDLTPYGNLTAWGIDINNQGQVIGSWGSVDPDPADGPPVETMLCPCYAVLWQNGTPVFLNNVVPSGWNLYLGLAINDRGEILAHGTFNGGRLRTVVLKPIPVTEQSGMPKFTPSEERKPAGTGPRALRKNRQGGFWEIQ